MIATMVDHRIRHIRRRGKNTQVVECTCGEWMATCPDEIQCNREFELHLIEHAND